MLSLAGRLLLVGLPLVAAATTLSRRGKTLYVGSPTYRMASDGLPGFVTPPSLRRASHACASGRGRSVRMEVFEGNPIGKAIWDWVWKLPIMKRGEQGAPILFGDTAHILRKNIEQIYGNEPSVDGAPLAEGEVSGFADGTAFLGLFQYVQKYGTLYKLCFGPKSFLVVSDPTIAKHILRTNYQAYDKGVLAEILEPIMGKGLIPADPETWKVRRRAIVPAFHNKWLEHMIHMFSECNENLVKRLGEAADADKVLDMETMFCSVSLDIIGKAVFNYPFDSVSKESPVIKAVYSVLQEAEHRSVTPFPYWDLPFANILVPRLRKFRADLKVINDVLNKLIAKAQASKHETDLEELENRNYDKVEDASMLRFLVDMRGEDVSNKQLRDDLMTMLIAGHETTAAVLTWALFELAQKPALLAKVQKEIDTVLGDRLPTLEDLKGMQMVRLCVAESLRMYPEPPLLIRRALEDHKLPRGTAGFEANIIRGTDIFLAVYNIHRSPMFWEKPDDFDPERFLRPFKNPDAPDWAGYDPKEFTGMYPSELAADFAFLPFGGGARKCVGDQFALFEATVTLAMVLRRFEFDFATDPKDVGMNTGATIHTRNGLNMRVRKRVIPEVKPSEELAVEVEAPVKEEKRVLEKELAPTA